MKFYLSFMLAGLLLCLYLLLTDGANSGMGWGVGIFAVLGVGVAVYNQVRFGSIFKDGK